MPTVLIVSLLFFIPGYSEEIVLDATAKPSCIDSKHRVICLHYFEQEKVLLENFLDGLCDDLMVRLIQFGSRLQARAGKPIMLPAGFCQTQQPVYMEMPRVKRTAAFDLQILTKQLNQTWEKANSFPVLVYPHDLLQPLKNWAKKNLLLVTGNGEKLTDFLAREQITYATRVTATNGAKVILHVGDLEADNPDHRFENSPIIVFREAVVDLPQIRAMPTRYGPRIYVEIKLLDSLAESPLVQTSFMKIFKLALDLHQKVGG